MAQSKKDHLPAMFDAVNDRVKILEPGVKSSSAPSATCSNAENMTDLPGMSFTNTFNNDHTTPVDDNLLEMINSLRDRVKSLEDTVNLSLMLAHNTSVTYNNFARPSFGRKRRASTLDILTLYIPVHPIY
jgi:hypothetical protein